MVSSAEFITLGVVVGFVLAYALTHLFTAISQNTSPFLLNPICESCGQPQSYKSRIPFITATSFSPSCLSCGYTPKYLNAVIEFVVIAFSIWAFSFLKPAQAIQISLMGFALLGVAYMDLKKWIIPNIFVVCVLAVAALSLLMGTISTGDSVRGLLIAAGVSLFIILPQRFGAGDKTIALGDVKLCLAVALWLGWILSVYVFFMASLLALGVWLISGLKEGFSSQRRVPFGPFVALSTLVFGIGRMVDPQFVTHLLTLRY